MSNWQKLKNNPQMKDIYTCRIEILRHIREFFWAKGFAETETPIAVRFPGQEPYLYPIPAEIEHPDNRKYRFYLRTSPEFALKKLLCAGWDKIFEIGKCFRNREDFGNLHNPEFTMLEWYRAPGTLQEIMDDLEELFKYTAGKLKCDHVLSNKKKIPILTPWERLSMKDVWKKYINIDLDVHLECKAIGSLANSRGYKVKEDEPYENIFYQIFLNEIEPKLGLDRPVLIYDFPACLCSLCKPCDDPRYAQRFECYIGGLELCNAFGELTDAEAQLEHLEKDQELRMKNRKEVFPIDPSFIHALQSGMPEAGGIALGVDRMVMLFTGARNINDVIFQAAGDQLEW